MNLTLNPAHRKFIAESVQGGQYESASDVVNEALAAFRAQHSLQADDIAELRELVDIGIAQLNRGETADFNAKDIQRLGRKVLAFKIGSGLI